MNAEPLHTLANDPELAELVGHGNQLQLAELLDDTRLFIRRFCVFPNHHALNAVTLWAAHARVVQHVYTTPRLLMCSPEAESGKTRVLDVLDLLVPEPMLVLNASPSAIFRTLAKRQITLLFDEVDAVWSKSGKDDNHEDLRALLNAGYKRGATIPRCVGPKHDVVDFPVFGAVALAGIGAVPDTIMTRSIIIKMRRRALTEPVESFRSREQTEPGHQIRDRWAAWAQRFGAEIGSAWPKLPDNITDRRAEIWEPLIAIADMAGEPWATESRSAAVALCKAANDRRLSLGVRLLSDIRKLFDHHGDPDALHTEVILAQLCAGPEYGLDDDAPWSDLRGKPLGVRGLATMLKEYDVSPIKVKVAGRSLQGYRREHLWDAWQRWLPRGSEQAEPAEPQEPTQPASSVGSTSSSSSDPRQRQGNGADVTELAKPRGDCTRCGGEGCQWCADQ